METKVTMFKNNSDMKNICLIFILTFLSAISFAQKNSVLKCKIWKPESFCNLPDSLNIPMSITGRNCTWDFKTCEEINKEGLLTGVWLSFKRVSDSCFFLESKYKNISLVKKSNKEVVHPSAILWFNSHDLDNNNCKAGFEYMTVFKVKYYKVNFKPKEKTDMILLFREAENGDEIIIDDFIQTLIKD
jgi:hypothetical protein